MRNVTGIEKLGTISRHQPTCETTIEVRYVIAVARRSGSSRATRSHWKTIGTRITTYPSTITRLSRTSPSSMDANMSGSPSARISTPIICTIVASR